MKTLNKMYFKIFLFFSFFISILFCEITNPPFSSVLEYNENRLELFKNYNQSIDSYLNQTIKNSMKYLGSSLYNPFEYIGVNILFLDKLILINESKELYLVESDNIDYYLGFGSIYYSESSYIGDGECPNRYRFICEDDLDFSGQTGYIFKNKTFIKNYEEQKNNINLSDFTNFNFCDQGQIGKIKNCTYQNISIFFNGSFHLRCIQIIESYAIINGSCTHTQTIQDSRVFNQSTNIQKNFSVIKSNNQIILLNPILKEQSLDVKNYEFLIYSTSPPNKIKINEKEINLSKYEIIENKYGFREIIRHNIFENISNEDIENDNNDEEGFNDKIENNNEEIFANSMFNLFNPKHLINEDNTFLYTIHVIGKSNIHGLNEINIEVKDSFLNQEQFKLNFTKRDYVKTVFKNNSIIFYDNLNNIINQSMENELYFKGDEYYRANYESILKMDEKKINLNLIYFILFLIIGYFIYHMVTIKKMFGFGGI